MANMVNVNISLPKKILEYVDREAEERYSSRASVAREYLVQKIEEKRIVEMRQRGYSIRKTSELTGIPYGKVLKVLGETQVDDKEG